MNKKILIFSIILLTLSIFVLAEDIPPGPAFGGEPNNESNDIITPDYTNTIEINEIKVEVDGKKDIINANGEKINEKAEEESELAFEIEVKNLFNKTIEGIEVSATIKDIGGEDIDDETDISRLDPENSKKITLNFKLPLKIDDNTYDVNIKIKGQDEDKKIHTLEWKLKLEVEKEKHKLRIIEALLSPSSISCSRYSDLTIKILNIGGEKETARIEIKNDELGINLKEYNIELDIGTEYDAEYGKIFSLNIPDSIKPGTYLIHINLYYNDDKFTATKDINLLVKECEQTGQIEQKEVALMITPSLETKETIGIQENKVQQSETKVIYIYEDNLLLIILLIIVAGFIIFLIGAIIIKLRI